MLCILSFDISNPNTNDNFAEIHLVKSPAFPTEVSINVSPGFILPSDIFPTFVSQSLLFVSFLIDIFCMIYIFYVLINKKAIIKNNKQLHGHSLSDFRFSYREPRGCELFNTEIKKDKSKIIYLSSSRVYPIDRLNKNFNLKSLKKKLKVI